ncbi:MAG: transcription antitermination factor NusB [Clostridia bacterium]|nr:transcription antitermination factor NusB [Clostridia bacterium]
MTRKEAREAVFSLLFETEFKEGQAPESIFATSTQNWEYAEDQYISDVYFGVCQKKAELDEIISRHAKGWKLNRMSVASRSIIRLATYEMKFMDSIPLPVSLDEAVELAKKFDDEKARPFINGVLNGIKDEIESAGSGERNA